jgi:hypothetical protein
LNRARALASADVRRPAAGFHDRAIELGRYEAVGGDVLLARFALARTEQVRAGDVQSGATWLLETGSVWIEGAGATPGREPRAALTSDGGVGGDSPALPGLEPIEGPLAVATGVLDGGTEARACRLPGTLEACVQIYLGPNPAVEAALRGALAEARASDPWLADYLSYHGIDLSVSDEGVRATGPPDRWEPMLEVAAKIVQRATPRGDWPTEAVGPVRIAVVVDEAADAVVETIRLHPQDWTLPAASARGGVSEARSPTKTEAARRVVLDSAKAIARRLAVVNRPEQLQGDPR